MLAIADAVAAECMSLVGYNPRGRVTPLTQEADSPPEGTSSAAESPGDGSGLAEPFYGSGGASGASSEGESRSEGGLASGSGEGLAEQTERVERLMQRYLHPRLRSTRALERFRNEVSGLAFLSFWLNGLR